MEDWFLIAMVYVTYWTVAFINTKHWIIRSFLCFTGLIYPWFIQDTFFKFVFGMSSIFLILRMVSLDPNKPWWYKLSYLSVFLEFRHMKENQRINIFIKLFEQGIIWIPVQFISSHMIQYHSYDYKFLVWLYLWALFVSGLYITDLIFRVIPMIFGYETISTMNDPFSSVTLSEFWSLRWNLIVRNCLADAFYKPMAKRNQKKLGMFLTFLFSGLYHVYPIFLISKHDMDAILNSLMMLSFFLVQFILIYLERKFLWKGGIYIFVVSMLTVPLFMEPISRMV
jgi:hypothetical protein